MYTLNGHFIKYSFLGRMCSLKPKFGLNKLLGTDGSIVYFSIITVAFINKGIVRYGFSEDVSLEPSKPVKYKQCVTKVSH